MKSEMEHYITPGDIAALTGWTEQHCYKVHRRIREALTPEGFERRKPKLTIGEYCRYNHEDFRETYHALRGKMPPGH